MTARRSHSKLRPFAVVVPKTSGIRVEFMRYDLESDARRAALLLRWAGSPAVVVGPQGELDLADKEMAKAMPEASE